MAECLKPRLAWQENDGEKPHFITSRDYIEVSKNNTYLVNKKLLLLPCGKCSNCLQNKSMEWTARLMKEAEEWEYCYFMTFTYDDSHLFYDVGGLKVRRNVLDIRTHKQLKKDIRSFNLMLTSYGYSHKYYFACESGENTGRTHWHAIIFLDFPLTDLVFYGNNLFTSQFIQKCWKNGLVTISSDVNRMSIQYTIGYTLKKLGEYKLQMVSKGLGFRYLKNKKNDIKFSNGFYLNKGYLINPPHYFIRKMKESSLPEDIEWVKAYENKETGSVKITKTLDDLFFEMVTKNISNKGKGVF